MKYLNENNYVYTDPILIAKHNLSVFNEEINKDELKKDIKDSTDKAKHKLKYKFKKFMDLSGKTLKALAGKDLTSDEDMKDIYYMISSLMSMNMILSGLPIPIIRVLPRITSKHLMTKTLPKYRKRLYTIYKNKIKDIDEQIEKIKDSDDKSSKQDEIKDLNIVKKQLITEVKRLNVVNTN